MRPCSASCDPPIRFDDQELLVTKYKAQFPNTLFQLAVKRKATPASTWRSHRENQQTTRVGGGRGTRRWGYAKGWQLFLTNFFSRSRLQPPKCPGLAGHTFKDEKYCAYAMGARGCPLYCCFLGQYDLRQTGSWARLRSIESKTRHTADVARRRRINPGSCNGKCNSNCHAVLDFHAINALNQF